MTTLPRLWGYVERTQAEGRFGLGIQLGDDGGFEVYGSLDELDALVNELHDQLDGLRAQAPDAQPTSEAGDA